MCSILKTTARIVAVLSLLAVSSLSAHEGHNDGAPQPAAELAPRVEAASKLLELVAVLHDGGLDLHLDSFLTNEPIANASIAIDTPDGTSKATPTSTGTYRLDAPWASKPGSYALLFDIKAGDTTDVLAATLIVPPTKPANHNDAAQSFAGRGSQLLLALGGFAAGIAAMGMLRNRLATAVVLTVALGFSFVIEPAHADTPAPAAATQDRSQRLADGSALVPKATQRILAIRTVLTAPAAHRRATEMPGRIVPDPNASGLVQAAVGGRLSAPPGGFPQLGTHVKTG